MILKEDLLFSFIFTYCLTDLSKCPNGGIEKTIAPFWYFVLSVKKIESATRLDHFASIGFEVNNH